jgi:hypothetical protein
MKTKSLFLTAVATIGLTAASMAQVPNYVPTNGLVGWWPFNGNANDESGAGNNGTVNGATLTADRFGNVNKAYSFDGLDDFISVNGNSFNYDQNMNFSVSLWVNVPNSCLDNNYCGGFVSNMGIQQMDNGLGFQIGYDNSNKIKLEYNTNLVVQSPIHFYSTSNINYNNWLNIVCVFDKVSDIVKIYFNGSLESTITKFWFSNSSINSNPLFFGKLRASDYYFSGKLDDIGIWNRALTQQEITDLYNANVCYDYVTVTDTLVINTGITGYNPITYMNTLKIWPNPSNDHITIDAGNLATMNGYSIKIEDAHGQQVFQNAVNQQQFYVDITTWGGNGLYFVRIIDPQGNTVDIKKIVLQ